MLLLFAWNSNPSVSDGKTETHRREMSQREADLTQTQTVAPALNCDVHLDHVWFAFSVP